MNHFEEANRIYTLFIEKNYRKYIHQELQDYSFLDEKLVIEDGYYQVNLCYAYKKIGDDFALLQMLEALKEETDSNT